MNNGGENSSVDTDISLLKAAELYAAKIHKGVFRKSGEPYITHPIAVMKIMQKKGFSTDVLCAALLHDTIEDSQNPKQTEIEILKSFGDETLFLVQALSKDQTMSDKELRDKKYFEQLEQSIERDPNVLFLKAADLLHNVSTIKYLSKERQERWISELKQFYFFHFLESFHLIPEVHHEFYHELVNKLQLVLEKHEEYILS